MSFVISLFVREGIVLAADSRLTLNTQENKPDGTVVNLSVSQSDSNYKVFATPQGFGLATFGAADIAGVPIAGYIDSFIREQLHEQSVQIDQVPDLLIHYFSKFSPLPQTGFHVAGYKTTATGLEQQVWNVTISESSKQRLNKPHEQGASWGGEADILARLIQPVFAAQPSGQPGAPLAHFAIPWQFFTLQDAIDFAIFAVRSTSDAIRFQPRPKTVGGPIDVLVIKPDAAEWIQRKRLHGETP